MSSSSNNEAGLKQTGQEDDVKSHDQDVDLTSIFDPAKLRRLLNHEEPKMAKIAVPLLKLIGTTSALFLKNVVGSAMEIDNSDGCVTLDKLQSVVSSNPSFQFLQEALEDVKDTDSSKNLKEYVSTSTKKRSASKSNDEVKKAKVGKLVQSSENKEWADDNAPLEEAIAIAANNTGTMTSDEIIVDEDDYD
jgi:hypothetical protein